MNDVIDEENKLNEVPKFFFDSKTPDECVLSVLSQLPPIFDPSFFDSLNKQIEIAENSMEIVTEELTKKVSASQNEIFDATSRFISLQEEIKNSTDYISSMRSEINDVRERTLDPMVDIYTHIRDLRRDRLNLIALHFIKSMLLIDENLHSRQFIIAAHNYRCTKTMLDNEATIYNDSLFREFDSIVFPEFDIDVSEDENTLTIGELKKLTCIQEILESIEAFPSTLGSSLAKEIESVSETFNEEKYAESIIAFCLITDSPPISKIIVDKYTSLLHDRAVAYFEALSDDLDTLFRFMDTNCALLTRFKAFTKFHHDHPEFTDIVKFIPTDIHIPIFDTSKINDIIKTIENSFSDSYEHFCRTAESNVLQFLSRLNCMSLDALSFIRLSRGLREFSSILSCTGLKDWLTITSTEYLQRYTNVCISSCKSSVFNESWAPVTVERDLIKHIQTKPSDEQIFEFDEDVDPTKRYTSSSSIQTVRIIHSLVCLAQELDANECFSLIIQVSLSYFVTLFNNFCAPNPIILVNESGQVRVNPKLARNVGHEFVDNVRIILRILKHLSLSEQKPIESSEAQLMQMIVGTEGLNLICWYLRGIRKYMVNYKLQEATHDKIVLAFNTLFNDLLPNVRPTLCAICAKNFLSLKQLKYQIIAQNWNVPEIVIECHNYCSIAKKSFEQLNKTLNSFQLAADTIKDIWKGSWIRVTNVLIRAFGSVRTCNSNGRSLMLGDTRAIAASFSNVSKCESDTTKIMEFVNAFFFTPQEYSKWLDKVITLYKPSYLINLTKTGLSCKISPKESKELVAKIEQMAQLTSPQITRKLTMF